jgi:hypothetical protein
MESALLLKRVKAFFTVATLAICGACGRKERPQPIVNPPAITVTPSSGEGPGAAFTLTLAPADRLGNTIGVLFNDRIDGQHSCYVTYDFGKDSFSLINDAGDLAQPFRPPNALMENKQCAVDGSGSTSEIGEHTLALRLAVRFKPAFAGPKNIYVYTEAGTKAGFESEGTWMVAP